MAQEAATRAAARPGAVAREEREEEMEEEVEEDDILAQATTWEEEDPKNKGNAIKIGSVRQSRARTRRQVEKTRKPK